MMKNRKLPKILAALALSTAVVGCSHRGLDDETERSTGTPTVRITGPERGSFIPERQVMVTGIVSDDDSSLDDLKLRVNGIPTVIEDDGSFNVLVPLGNGVTLVQTEATDLDGNVGTDTRGVIAGNLVPAVQPSHNALVAYLGEESFSDASTTLQNFVLSPELLEFGKGFGNFVDVGGSCLGARVSLADIDLSDADIRIWPTDGQIEFSARLENPDVTLATSFDVACIGGDADFIATADEFYVSGAIRVSLENELELEMVNVQSRLEGVTIDYGVLSNEVIQLLPVDIDQRLSDFVGDMMVGKFTDFVDDFVEEFALGQTEILFQEKRIQLGVLPTKVEINAQGALLMADGTASAPDGMNLGYVATPKAAITPAELSDDIGFAGAVADDFLNQVFAAFWASGALNGAVAFRNENEGASTPLGSNIDRVEVSLLLPPYIDGERDDGVVLTVGDMIIDFVREGKTGDEVVTRISLSGSMRLNVSSDENNRLRFKTDAPQIWVDVLSEGVTGSNPIQGDQIEILASFIAGRMVSAIDDMIGEVPLPSVAGSMFRLPKVGAQNGFVVVGGDIDLPSN